jgi:hypothetical protein
MELALTLVIVVWGIMEHNVNSRLIIVLPAHANMEPASMELVSSLVYAILDTLERCVRMLPTHVLRIPVLMEFAISKAGRMCAFVISGIRAFYVKM